MAPGLAPGQADVADDDYQAATGDKDPVDMAPYSIEFIKEEIVVHNLPKLLVLLGVLLESPVGRRRHNEVNALIREKRKVTAIGVYEAVLCR